MIVGEVQAKKRDSGDKKTELRFIVQLDIVRGRTWVLTILLCLRELARLAGKQRRTKTRRAQPRPQASRRTKQRPYPVKKSTTKTHCTVPVIICS